MATNTFTFPPPPPPPPHQAAYSANGGPRHLTGANSRGQSSRSRGFYGRSRAGYGSSGRASTQSYGGRQGSDHGHGHQAGYKNENRGPGPRHTSSAVAPAVPSFGMPIPMPSVEREEQVPGAVLKPTKALNPLGLTPQANDAESGDADEVDEEVGLVASQAENHSNQPLQVTYKGKTMKLQTPEEIALWISERRRNYPNKARAAEVAERNAALKAAQQAAKDARREAQRKRGEEARLRHEAKKNATKSRSKSKPVPANSGESAIADAQKRMAMLRAQLAVEEKRFAEAQAKCNTRAADGPEPNNDNHAQTSRSREDAASLADSSSIISEDLTSSSGSSSDASSEDDSDDEPEQTSSGPGKRKETSDAPCSGQGGKRPCHSIARGKRCNYGQRCKYSHRRTSGPEPVTNRGRADQGQTQTRRSRISLYQRLVDREKEQENQEESTETIDLHSAASANTNDVESIPHA